MTSDNSENIKLETNDKCINTNINEVIPYKTTIITNRRTRMYHDICMVINYMIISGTLLLLTYFLYNLTSEIRKIDVANVTNGLTSINDNLYSISTFGNKLNNHIETFETLTVDNLDMNKVNELMFDINQTLFRLNDFMFSVKNYQPLQGITTYEYDILQQRPDPSSISETTGDNSATTSSSRPLTPPEARSIPSISNNKPF